nr:hypothetical protein CFP56_09939 [Quercus suber]
MIPACSNTKIFACSACQSIALGLASARGSPRYFCCSMMLMERIYQRYLMPYICGHVYGTKGMNSSSDCERACRIPIPERALGLQVSLGKMTAFIPAESLRCLLPKVEAFLAKAETKLWWQRRRMERGRGCGCMTTVYGP